VRTIRPDTVFIPYHWADRKSANMLTHRTIDPRSKIPEFKVSACRVRKGAEAPDWAKAEEVVNIGEPAPFAAKGTA
jgi:assimilatory nitrate reductase catalytic subunit